MDHLPKLISVVLDGMKGQGYLGHWKNGIDGED